MRWNHHRIRGIPKIRPRRSIIHVIRYRPDAHAATTHRITRLRNRYPLLLPLTATLGWDTRLPMDTKTITPVLFTQAFPAGTDIITTSPPMLLQHLSRAHREGGQPAQAALLQIVRLIQHLATNQPGGVGFIWDTSVRTPLPAHVIHLMGPSTALNAPKCGSGAHRPTHIWQNFLPQQELEAAYKSLQDLPRAVDVILATAGLEEWRTPRLADPIVPEQTLLPRFGTRSPSPHQYAYGSPPARGLLLHGWIITSPSPKIRELLMGFTRGDTTAPGLTPEQRIHLLGQCTDLNILTWTLSATGIPSEEPDLRPRTHPG